MKCRRSECRIVFVLAAIAAIAGCARQERPSGDTARGGDTEQVQLPPEPAFGSPDTAQRAAVVEYARQVRFVSDHALTDEQGLLLRGTKGPTVRVQAAEYAHQLNEERLARGVVIARFISTGDYAPLGLRRGIHYVFADRAAGSWRSIIVPENTAQRVRVMQMAVLRVPHLLEAPIARFVELGGLTYTYIRCQKLCCIPCDPVGYQCPPGLPQLDSINFGETPAQTPVR